MSHWFVCGKLRQTWSFLVCGETGVVKVATAWDGSDGDRSGFPSYGRVLISDGSRAIHLGPDCLWQPLGRICCQPATLFSSPLRWVSLHQVRTKSRRLAAIDHPLHTFPTLYIEFLMVSKWSLSLFILYRSLCYTQLQNWIVGKHLRLFPTRRWLSRLKPCLQIAKKIGRKWALSVDAYLKNMIFCVVVLKLKFYIILSLSRQTAPSRLLRPWFQNRAPCKFSYRLPNVTFIIMKPCITVRWWLVKSAPTFTPHSSGPMVSGCHLHPWLVYTQYLPTPLIPRPSKLSSYAANAISGWSQVQFLVWLLSHSNNYHLPCPIQSCWHDHFLQCESVPSGVGAFYHS